MRILRFFRRQNYLKSVRRQTQDDLVSYLVRRDSSTTQSSSLISKLDTSLIYHALSRLVDNLQCVTEKPIANPHKHWNKEKAICKSKTMNSLGSEWLTYLRLSGLDAFGFTL